MRRRAARLAGAASGAALLAGCMAPPSVDPESGIAQAVGAEYRRFIEEAQGDMGFRGGTARWRPCRSPRGVRSAPSP